MPTRSTAYSWMCLARSASAGSSSRSRTIRPGWWKNVFSCRKSTVSLPISKARGPAPTVTRRIGGAEAASRDAFVSSVT